MKICSIDNCESKHYAKKLCRNHYSNNQYHSKKILKKLIERKCSIPGCEDKHDSNNYCKRHARIYRTYSITPEFYQSILDKQSGVCAICLMNKILVIDHDHITGKVRGLLCTGCNTAIGKLGDSADGIRRALDYLC